jgi:hypothetical protein
VGTVTEPVTPTPAQGGARRRRRWRWLLACVVVVGVGAAVALWLAFRPPKPVSVGDVVDRFRSEQPIAPASALPAAPAAGVYVYATRGSEHISVGGMTHRYPARTTLTVTVRGCGLQLRWDALSGRWQRAQLCARGSAWVLTHYTDAHKFLYLQDVHDYSCDPPVAAADGWSVACTTAHGRLVSTTRRVGAGMRRLSGRMVRTTHLRIDQTATGASVSTGTIDAWVLASGLPVHVRIVDHGSQVVLGSRVSYDESATYDLTSDTPLR